MASEYIYLDHAAATPLDNSVLAVMQPFFHEQYYNPSAFYLPAVKVREALDSARKEVAACIGARPAEIIFTAGGSEANNLAIHGVMKQFPAGHIVTTAIEHDSVLKAAKHYDVSVVGVRQDAVVDIDAILSHISDRTVLVSVMYANNEVGTIQSIRQIGKQLELIRTKRRRQGNSTPLWLHTDAAQAGNYLDLHVSRLGVQLMTVNGSKLYGPKQSGMLYVQAGLQLTPLIDGGGQEQGLRSGTENVAGSVGLARALSLATNLRLEEKKRIEALQQAFIAGLFKINQNVIVNGSTRNRLSNNVHVSFPGEDNERLLLQLEQRGILAAAGSACSASSDEPSHVLAAMGLTENAARSSVRFTFGRGTTKENIETVLVALGQLLA